MTARPPAASVPDPPVAVLPAVPGLPARLTVVVPCYDEVRNVGPLVEALAEALAGIAWEVLFVDDDSPDGTAAAVRAIAARDPRVRCLRRVGRRGLASACIEGMLASSAPFVAVMDGDLQHDETLLPRMLAVLEGGGAEVVVGSRHVAGGDQAGAFSAARGRVSALGARLARALLPVPVADPMSGFFMLPRAVAEAAAPRLNGGGFKILLDLLLSAGRPLAVRELPYRFRARGAGQSKLDALVLLEYLGLLLDKALGGVLPLRFVSFALVGASGVLVHLAALALLYGPLAFGPAQVAATLVAMTANFALNNVVTYRDQRLRGPRLLRGLLLFYAVCGVGAAANVGLAALLQREHLLGWGLAGAAGALLTVVWNYAVSATLVWRGR